MTDNDTPDYSHITDDQIRAKASEMYADDEHEFDGVLPTEKPDADLSKADDGCWVRGWYWIPYDSFDKISEWSGSPDPEDPDNYWIDDVTGERIKAEG